MVGEPQGAMRVTSQIWQVVFASQTLPIFCFSLRKKAQYVVVILKSLSSSSPLVAIHFIYSFHVVMFL
jgi:hypothetical protein